MTSPTDGEHDIFGPLERSGVVRGWLIVVVAVVIGIVLMPSATRTAAPAVASGASTTSTTTITSPSSSTSSPSTTAASGHATTTTTLARGDLSAIKVLVANGTNTNGAAAATSSFLSGKGFSTLTPVDATTTVHASQIYAVGGAAADAAEVASVLGLSSSSIEPASMPPPVSSTGGANVVVIVGPDLQSR